jgi:hypothetical protein
MHGLTHGAALIWMGIRLREFDIESQESAKSRPVTSSSSGLRA